MIISEEAYVQHFGVPGMKWGVRRAERKAVNREVNTAVSDAKAQKRSSEMAYKEAKAVRRQLRTTNAKRKTKKLAIGGLAVGTVAAGAALSLSMLSKHGTTPVRNLPTWNFSAEGPNFKIGANDAKTFEMLANFVNENRGRP